MSFRDRCKRLCYKIPIGLMIALCAISALFSIMFGCFIPSNRIGICLPRFSLPTFFLTLLIMLAHMLLVLGAFDMLLDNIRCKYNIIKLIAYSSIYFLSCCGFNILLRTGATVLSSLCFILCAVLALFITVRDFCKDYILSVSILVIMTYFFFVSIFAY